MFVEVVGRVCVLYCGLKIGWHADKMGAACGTSRSLQSGQKHHTGKYMTRSVMDLACVERATNVHACADRATSAMMSTYDRYDESTQYRSANLKVSSARSPVSGRLSLPFSF